MVLNKNGIWPVPDSYTKQLPVAGKPGSFWENRGDRFHCGADVYAPVNSPVVAILDGIVVQIGIFTQQEQVHYWNQTFYILVKSNGGHFIKYAELGSVGVKEGDKIKTGEKIATVGQVLNPGLISQDDPPYIQALKNKANNSMLHIECYEKFYTEYDDYLGGNLFNKYRPENLVDPAVIIINGTA